MEVHTTITLKLKKASDNKRQFQSKRARKYLDILNRLRRKRRQNIIYFIEAPLKLSHVQSWLSELALFPFDLSRSTIPGIQPRHVRFNDKPNASRDSSLQPAT